MKPEELDRIESAALAACQDPDIWASVELPGFDAPDREFVATCNPQVVLALVAEIRRPQPERRCPGCGYTKQQWEFRKLRAPKLVCEHAQHWGGPTT